MSAPNLSFDNTRIAFITKSRKGLRRAYWLFRLLQSNTLVNLGPMALRFAQLLRMPVMGIVKATIYKQFVGGEDIEECQRTIDMLGKYKVGSILDYSAEGSETEEVFEHNTQEIIKTIHRAAGDDNIPFSVFKVTGLARLALLQKVSEHKSLSIEEEEAFEKVEQRVADICRHAAEQQVPVLIDAEESWIQNAIDDLTTAMMTKHNGQRAIVYNTVQMYRHDRLSYLKKSYIQAQRGQYKLGIKIVRGAYLEKEKARALKFNYPSPIHPSKAATDMAFDEAIKFCVEQRDDIAIISGTHNEASSYLLAELMAMHNIDPGQKQFYFSQLLGMSDHISFNLANSGYNVVKYVPYGPVEVVIPYLTRRAQENTSISGQTGRELQLIVREMNRRKTEK